MVGFNDPKKYPKSPDEIGGKKRTPTAFTKEQWAEAIASIIAGSEQREASAKKAEELATP